VPRQNEVNVQTQKGVSGEEQIITDSKKQWKN
jgi:hypothetical protein